MLMKDALITHLYQYRRYIWRNAWNELRYRYAGTKMGIFWNVLHPLVVIGLYTLIFSWIFPLRAQSGSYVLYLTSGLLAWRVFAETIQRGGNAFIEHARYLKRLPIPAEVFLAQQTLTATFMLFFYYLLLIPVNIISGNRIGVTILALPLVLIALQGLAFGMSLTLANLRALFPDVEQIMQAVLPLWMWTLPIIYPESVLPETLRGWLALNPPYVFLRAIRQTLIDQQLPGGNTWLMIAGWLFVTIGIGARVHQKFQVEVRETI